MCTYSSILVRNSKGQDKSKGNTKFLKNTKCFYQFFYLSSGCHGSRLKLNVTYSEEKGTYMNDL